MKNWILILALLAYLTAESSAQEGGIEIFSGETLFEDGLRFSFTELYKPKKDLFRGSDEVGDPMGRSLKEFRSVLGVDYGIDRNATLSVLLPIVHRELETGGQRLSAAGLGDVALLGKYRVFYERGKASVLDVALVGGLEVPTGATDASENGTRLPTSVQVGKGAWSPFLATSLTAGFDRARIDATVFYKLNTEGAQQREDGNFFSATVSAAYRFVHYKYPGPTFGARLGLQWRHEGRAEVGGANAANSGADELLLNPAISIHPVPSMDLNIGARIPIYQHYNGEQLGRGLEFIFAMGFRF